MANKVVQLVDENNDNLYPLSSDPNAAHITMTTTDPGEGAALGQNEFVAVYGGSTKVGTSDIVDGAVTSDKIDWTTINNSYSTSEVDTHMKWIDGRTIYKKTIDVGQLPSAVGAKTVAHGITNFGKVVRMEGVAINTNNTTSYMLPYSDKDGATYSIGVTANSTNVSVSVGRDRSTLDECYVTIYYTKSS